MRLILVPTLVLATVLIAWRLGYFRLDHRQRLAESALQLHAIRWSEAFYVLLYTVAISAMLPAAVMTLLGGAVFGAWEGAVLAWLGSIGATCLAHLLARRILRSAVQRTLGEHRLLRRLRERADILALFQLRILPVAPFATLDYIAGIAGVALRRLVAATALGVIPSVVAYSFVGASLMRGIRAGERTSHQALWIAGGVTALMLLLSLVPMLVQRLRD
jgi:uncharacterized membrane protein YdjX (TVP38/TMEM64 family)